MGNKVTINRRRIPRTMPFPLQEPLPKSTVRPYFIGFLLVGFSPLLLLIINNHTNNNNEPPPFLIQDKKSDPIEGSIFTYKTDDNNSDDEKK